MSKYSFELKMIIIREYLKGKGGYPYLAKKYAIKSMGQVRNWVKSYQEFGEEGLLRKRQNQSYSVQFKMNAIKLYQTTELSYREMANHLGINNPSLVADWMRIFRTEGIDGLSKTKGRPSILPKKKEEKKTKKETSEERDRIKELEKKCVSFRSRMPF